MVSGVYRIFLRGVGKLAKVLLFCKFFAENCMKMKEFAPGGVPGAPLRSVNDGHYKII